MVVKVEILRIKYAPNYRLVATREYPELYNSDMTPKSVKILLLLTRSKTEVFRV